MFENLFSESTGLYFYSAAFQGNMALLALAYIITSNRVDQIVRENHAIAEEVHSDFKKTYLPIDLGAPFTMENLGNHIKELEGLTKHEIEELDEIKKVKREEALKLRAKHQQYSENAARIGMLQECGRHSFWKIGILAIAALLGMSLMQPIHQTIVIESLLYVIFILAQILVLRSVGMQLSSMRK